jgi:hypothetical protein
MCQSTSMDEILKPQVKALVQVVSKSVGASLLGRPLRSSILKESGAPTEGRPTDLDTTVHVALDRKPRPL